MKLYQGFHNKDWYTLSLYEDKIIISKYYGRENIKEVTLIEAIRNINSIKIKDLHNIEIIRRKNENT